MRIVESEVIFEPEISGEDILKKLEKVARTCYKSEDRISETSAAGFIRGIVKSGHEAMIEHVSLTVRIICDRGISHEIVRHRLCSFAQESTRYCSYNKDKFGNEISVICPKDIRENEEMFKTWKEAMEASEKAYMQLLKTTTPQIARSVLPTALRTEIVVTANLREWRHFLKLRTESGAHPQIREIAFEILKIFRKHVPVIFDDIIADGEVRWISKD